MCVITVDVTVVHLFAMLLKASLFYFYISVVHSEALSVSVEIFR